MKKIFFSLLILFAVALTSSASELLNIPYKNIKEEDKIKLNNDVWTNKISRRDSDYFVKIVSDGTGSYSESVSYTHLLRDVVLLLRNNDIIDSFEVECESLESIHNHSAWAYQYEG